MSQKYLLIKTTLFIDPHGSPDVGGEEKEVVSGKEYDKFYEQQSLPENENKQLTDDGEWLEEDEFNSSEDGYNSQYTVLDLKPITDEKAEEYQQIIKDYNKIK